jgi:MYXO-CTERM domain-containing protein
MRRLLRHPLVFLVPAVALGWVTRGLLAGEVYAERDQLLLFVPLKRYLAERLRAGDFPDWWPWDGLGQPLAAIPVASVFHPSTLAYLALPFEWALALQALLPFPVALLGAWALARSLGLRRWAASASATLFTCGFYFVALSEQTQMHLAAMTLPWAWREALVVARLRRASWTGLALAVANLLVGGDPMLLELAALGALPLLVAAGFRWERLLRVAGAATVGLCLGALQWVPMLFIWSESPRAAGLGIDTSDFWALRLEHVRGLLLPGSFQPESFLFESTYLGAPALLLAALGLWERWRWRWVLLSIALVAAWLAVGRAGLLWSGFGAIVPGWRGFQFPAKALAPSVLALSLLAGRGVAVALRHPLGSSALLAGLSAALLLVGPWTLCASGLLAAGALAASRVGGRAGLAAAPLLVAALGLDQLLHGARVDTMPWSDLREPPVAAALRAAGVGPVGQRYLHAWPLPPVTTAREGLDLELLSARPASGAWWGLPTSAPYLQAFTRRYYDVALADKAAWLSRRATLFGTSAFVVAASDLQPAQRPRLLFEDARLDLAVLRASRSMPLAWVTWDVRRVPEADTLAALASKDFPWTRQVLVPADGPRATDPALEQASTRGIQPVEVARDGDEVTLSVSLDQPGVLVWNEAFTEATEAFDAAGQALPLFPANHAVVGVSLGAGTHRVRIVRHTPGLPEGAGLTLAGVLALALRRRRQEDARA